LVPLLHQGETFLVPTSERQVCVGAEPTVCVAPGYAAFAGSTRDALLPFLRALTGIGAPVPTTFRQNVEPGQETVGPIESGLILGDHRQAGFAVLAAYLSKKCPIDASSRLQTDYSGLAYWLFATVDGEHPADPTVPQIVTGAASPAQTRWLRGAIDDLRRCTA
jgi:hypothetical protein